MTVPVVLRAHQISKCYHRYARQRSRLLHALWPDWRQGVEDFWALQDVDFELSAGESVAIIGRNGSGKSTLLEILTGTLAPTRGAVSVQGRVAALLELGSGFHPEYSGRDNVFLNAQLLGLSRQEVEQRFDDIAAFADIGDVLDHPVKTYSSGMLVRLAFAVQIALDPQILIVDEALSVGDYFFQQKCFRRLRQMRDNGLTLLFVSHDMGAVRDLCSRALYLQRGRLLWDGEVNTAVQRYLAEESADTSPVVSPEPKGEDSGSTSPVASPWGDSPWWKNPQPLGSGTELLAVTLADAAQAPLAAVRIGEEIVCRLWYRADAAQPVHATMVIKNRYDQVVNASGSYTLGMDMPATTHGEVRVFEWRCQMKLEAGQYGLMFSLGCVDGRLNQGATLAETPWLGPLTVLWDYASQMPPFYGMFGLPVTAALLKNADDGQRQ